MRILLAATPASGHLNPILAVARILIADGHDTVVTTASVFQKKVEEIGARFAALPAGADIDLSDINAVFPERNAIAPGLQQLAFDFEHMFIKTIPAQFAGIEALLQHFPAELIIVDTMFGGCLPFLLGARAQRPAIAGLGVTCLLTRRDDGAPIGPGLPPATAPEVLAQYRAIAADVDTHLLEPARQRVDEILKALGAAPLPMPFIDALVSLHDIFLQPSVPGFDFPYQELPSNLHFIGALPVPSTGPLSSELVSAISKYKRVVLVTQGTVANVDLGQLIGPAVTVLSKRADVLILVATGGRPLSAMPVALPSNALAAEFLPFGALMPHIDLLITNGGYGAVTQAVSCGVPIIAGGTSEDKQEVNARIDWCGVGIDLRTDTPSVAQLEIAISNVLDNATFRNRAYAIAAEFSSYDAEAALNMLLKQTVHQHYA